MKNLRHLSRLSQSFLIVSSKRQYGRTDFRGCLKIHLSYLVSNIFEKLEIFFCIFKDDSTNLEKNTKPSPREFNKRERKFMDTLYQRQGQL